MAAAAFEALLALAFSDACSGETGALTTTGDALFVLWAPQLAALSEETSLALAHSSGLVVHTQHAPTVTTAGELAVCLRRTRAISVATLADKTTCALAARTILCIREALAMPIAHITVLILWARLVALRAGMTLFTHAFRLLSL